MAEPYTREWEEDEVLAAIRRLITSEEDGEWIPSILIDPDRMSRSEVRNALRRLERRGVIEGRSTGRWMYGAREWRIKEAQ